MWLKRSSITIKIGRFLLILVLLMGMSIGTSLLMLKKQQTDTELMNEIIFLKTQSYDLLYEIENKNEVSEYILFYKTTLSHQIPNRLNKQYFLPSFIKKSYYSLISKWEILEASVKSYQLQSYQENLGNYIEELDRLLLSLQRYIDKQNNVIFYFLLMMMVLILLVMSLMMIFVHKKITQPITHLFLASSQIQLDQLGCISFFQTEKNEISHLYSSFSQMLSMLQDLYLKLEKNINEKTSQNYQANHSLNNLYQCSQILNEKSISHETLKSILKRIYKTEKLSYLYVNIFNQPNLNTILGKKDKNSKVKYMELNIENHSLGFLEWQSSLSEQRCMLNIVQMLTQSLYSYYLRQQQDYFLILEERSIIARELHDSLAQVLTFLKIQLAILKGQLLNMEVVPTESLTIINEFEQALMEGNSQLRELMSHFRLTVKEADLKSTLEEVVNSLRSRTEIIMNVQCHLSHQSFDAQDLVHILQIVREAILNAIKHSKGKHIDIIAQLNKNEEYEIIVKDDGVGIENLDEPDGHYGLTIMTERANKLNAKLSIEQDNGTVVKLIFK